MYYYYYYFYHESAQGIDECMTYVCNYYYYKCNGRGVCACDLDDAWGDKHDQIENVKQ